MKCKSCGADIPRENASCPYCGTLLQRPGRPTAEEIFQRVEQSPEYARRDSEERRGALPRYPALARVLPLAVIVAFIGVSVVIAFSVLAVAGVFGVAGGFLGIRFSAGLSLLPLGMAICPLAFIALGAFLLLQIRRKHREFEAAPVLARPALIAGKRREVSGVLGDSSATTRYYITAEFADGSREEFQTLTPMLYSRLAEQDAGVLFTRAALALDFDRVVV